MSRKMQGHQVGTTMMKGRFLGLLTLLLCFESGIAMYEELPRGGDRTSGQTHGSHKVGEYRQSDGGLEQPRRSGDGTYRGGLTGTGYARQDDLQQLAPNTLDETPTQRGPSCSKCENCGYCKLSKKNHDIASGISVPASQPIAQSLESKTRSQSLESKTRSTTHSSARNSLDHRASQLDGLETKVHHLESLLQKTVEGSVWECDNENFCDCEKSKWTAIGAGTCLAGAGSLMFLQGLGHIKVPEADIIADGVWGNMIFLGLLLIVTISIITLGLCSSKSSDHNRMNYLFAMAVSLNVISVSAVVATVLPFTSGETVLSPAGLIISCAVLILCCALTYGMITFKKGIPCLTCCKKQPGLQME